jgi:choline-sulfatase
MSKMEESDHFESFVTRESIRFLKQYAEADEPFFLIASYLKPHGPFNPAARFFHQFKAEDMELPDTWGRVDLATAPEEIRNSIDNDWLTPELRDPANAKKRIALYYASLMQMDDNVGEVLQALRNLGLEEDTIVLYTSDHGEMLGEHGLWQKTVFYEESAGVPLIMRVPGLTPKNARSKTPVSLVSVVPTLLELCGVPAPEGLDGESIVQDLREPTHTRDTTIYSEYGLHSRLAKAMIREGTFKYTHYSHDAPDELYDLSADSQEMHNLALQPQFADRVAQMKAKLFAWHQPA